MDPPPSTTPPLATIFLDNAAVGLMEDPRPRVAKIVAATGQRPETVLVWRMTSSDDLKRRPVRMEDAIDRTEQPTTPIYLTSTPNVARPSIFAPTSRPAPVTSKGNTFAPRDGRPRPVPRGPLPTDLGGQALPSVTQRVHYEEAEWDP